jgi:RND superfamily putative drug exporter
VSPVADRLARGIARHRWLILALWLVVMAAAGLAALSLPGRLSGGGWYVPGSQSQAAAAALRSGFASRGASNLVLVVTDDRYPAGSGQFTSRARMVVREVSADPRLKVSGSYGWATLSPAARQQFAGRDHRTTITFLALSADEGTARRVLPAVQAQATSRFAPGGLRVALVSADSFFGEINTLSQHELERAELIALPLLLFILVLLFRGVVATVVSFVVSATALTLTFGVLSVLARHFELSIFVQNAATMIGLGVSVDYSLFMITRYSGELSAGRDRLAALARTLRTSGEAVASAGLIVVLAMSTLFLVELNVIQSIALGVVVVVACAVLASVLVLPAVLYLLGDRVLRGGLPWARRRQVQSPAGGGRWYRLAEAIMRRPASFLVIAVLALLALAAPAAGLRTFTPDARILPPSSSVRGGYDTMARQFGPGAASPIEVVVVSPRAVDAAGIRSILALRARLAALPHVARVDPAPAVLRSVAQPPPTAPPLSTALAAADARATAGHFASSDRRTVVLEVTADGSASSADTLALLGQVRADARQLPGGQLPGALRADVGGESAEGVDANALLGQALPRVLLVMLGVIYLMLLLTFRSALLPVKAILMNLLSVGATFGVLVLVFQHGAGARLVGAGREGYLQNFVPILLLVILFSLSTDYEVFLLSRVREEYRAGRGNTVSVAAGMARTAPLISGAALLMIAVFAAFAFTGILPIQQLGFGLAVAIALDATVIRLVVVPAAMKLMGRWNWWLPHRSGSRPRTRPAATPQANRANEEICP